VANQFVIQFEDQNGRAHEIFQSYNTVIARADWEQDFGTRITLDNDWNWSNTTRKYLYSWLASNGYSYCNKASVLRRIAEGDFKLANLN
jgi:hypothetical protein